MADIVTTEQLQNASLDVQTIEKFVNGSETQVNKPRLRPDMDVGSIAELRKKVQDKVDLQLQTLPSGHKGYATLAAAQAAQASLPTNTLVEVVSDSTASNNGVYLWNGTTLAKSSYDPKSTAVAEAKTYTDQKDVELKTEIRSNDKTQNLTSLINVANQIWNMNGTVGSSWTGYYRTNKIQAKKGDVIKVRTRMNDGYPILLVFDSNQTTVIHSKDARQIVADADGEKTYIYTMPQDGYFATQKKPEAVNASLTINEGLRYFVQQDGLSSEPVIVDINNKKADKTKKSTLLPTDYTRYNATNAGVLSTDIEPKNVLGTAHLKLTKGMVVEVKRAAPYYYYAIRSGNSENVTVNSGQWWNDAGQTYTVTKDVEYVRVFIRKDSNTELTESDALNIVGNIINVTISDGVAYSQDWRLKLDDTNKRIATLGLTGHTSNFRAPSLATGGVVTIIDDDGKSDVHSLLWPMLKALDVPFGVAIVPSKIDVDPAYMTLAQLKELEADDKYVEIMNHSWSHLNLASLTNPQIHKEIYRTKRWFIENGFDADALVLPYGGDNEDVQRVVQQYYPACYDFGTGTGLHTFDTMQNYLIKRSNFGVASGRLAQHKALVDQCAASNGWFVITTHVLLDNYWNETSQAELTELINYIKSKGCKFMKPRDAFQVFGNIVENDSGFKITANGKIIGAT